MTKAQIEQLLEERVAPLLAVDGGVVEVVELDEEACRVVVRYGGSYCGAPVRDIVTDLIVEPVVRELGAAWQVGWID